MKILMSADTVGGVWTYAMELARSLSKLSVRVAVATMGPRPSASQRAQIADIPDASLYESEYKLEWMDNPWRDVEMAGEWLLGLEEVLQPNIVHLNGFAHGALPWKAPTVVVAHSCVLSWWLAVKAETVPENPWGIYREKVRAGLDAADYVVTPTLAMLKSVQDLYGRGSRHCVIPNGRDALHFYDSMEKKPFVGSAGRLWDEAKNIAALDRIAGQINWPICLAGSVTSPAQAERSHSTSCFSMGQLGQEAFALLLGRAAIFCLPALYEPFGLSILEAALSGCALILGDIASLRELWDGAAVFVNPKSDGEIARALNDLIGDPLERIALGKKARLRASHFTAERMSGKYLELYSMLLDENHQFKGEKQVGICAS